MIRAKQNMKTGIYEGLVKRVLWIVLFPFGAMQVGMILGGYVLINSSDAVCQIFGTSCEPTDLWLLMAIVWLMVSGLGLVYSLKQAQKLSHSIAQPLTEISFYLEANKEEQLNKEFQESLFAEFDAIHQNLKRTQNELSDSLGNSSRAIESDEDSSSEVFNIQSLQQQLSRLVALTDQKNEVIKNPADRIKIKQLCQKILSQLDRDEPQISLNNETQVIQPRQTRGIYIQGFDFSELLLLINNNQAQLLNILQMFVEDFGTVNQEVKEYLQQEQIDRAEERIHQVKGTAGNIGANELLKISQLLDDELKKNKVDMNLWKQWEAVFSVTIQNVRRCLADNNIHMP